MAETEYETILVPELLSGVPDNGALFPYSNANGKLFKMNRQQYLAFIASASGVAKTTLDVTGGTPIVINWQSDVDPSGDGEQTYGQRHGFNVVPAVFGAALDENTYIPYNTNFTYTGNGTGVLVVTIPDTYTGKLTII